MTNQTLDQITLPSAESSLVLSAFAGGASVAGAVTYRPDYLEYPVRVTVRTALGDETVCALKKIEKRMRLEHEARMLGIVSDLGLEVPVVMAGPADVGDGFTAIVLSELPGSPLDWVDERSLDNADRTCRLAMQAIDRLHAMTEQVRSHPQGSSVPEVTLYDEIEAIHLDGGEWFNNTVFARAVDALPAALRSIETPLVFTNGDYNVINFMHGGDALTGFLDFEHACFEDPYIGFAKFLMWGFDDFGWGAGPKSGIVERYLYRHNVSRREFAPRLILRCLTHLQRDVSALEDPASRYRQYAIGLIEEALEVL